MNNTELIELLQELTAMPVETEWIEFKMNKGSIPDEVIGEYISAMSNGAAVANKPFGYLVWGVEDGTHMVKGTNFRITQSKHGGNQELELFLRLGLSPKINFEIFEFEYQSLPITLLRIPAAKSEPTNFQKNPYVRIGSNKTNLRNFPDLMRIIYNSQEDWSAKIIENAGNFYEGLPNDYTVGSKTPTKYRNQWLATAMVNLGMIDRLGYGIHSLCLSQMKRFFPMPDYDLLQQNKVILKIYGQEIDSSYSKMLIQRNDLTLTEAILLDRIQKNLEITDSVANELRRKNLIEGRKPNYFVGAKIARITDKKAEYSKHKGMSKQYYLDFILQAIAQHGSMNRKDIDGLLWNKLPEIINDKQKKNMITNLISELRINNKIVNVGTDKNSEWILKI